MLDSASVSEYRGSGDNQGGVKDKVFITESLLSSSILYESGILIVPHFRSCSREAICLCTLDGPPLNSFLNPPLTPCEMFLFYFCSIVLLVLRLSCIILYSTLVLCGCVTVQPALSVFELV